MIYIPDRISMDDLSNLWIERALKAIEAENQPQQTDEDQEPQQQVDESQEQGS
jgi:hypothetical protein